MALAASAAAAGPAILASPDDPPVRRVSIRELESDPALVGRRLVVRGRFDCLLGPLLRLKQCDVDFLLDPGAQLVSRTGTNLELEGTLQRRDGQLVFRVARLRPAPSDEAEYARRRSAARRAGDPAAWYGLAEWARSEGDLYDDPRLLQWATEAAREGIRLEERHALGERDREALAALAARAAQLGLPQDVDRISFEAFCVRWSQADRTQPDELERFADELARTLPGCEEPAPLEDASEPLPAPVELFDRYPAAGEDQRRAWHRELWASATEAVLRLRFEQDETGGFHSARLASQLLPDRPELAEEFIDRALTGQAAQVADLERPEATALITRYQQAGRKEEAEALFRSWLEAQWLAPGTADERLALARDYLSLGDREPAVVLLLDAWDMQPGADAVAQELEALDYRLTEQGWMRAEAVERSEAGRRDRMARAGRIEAGMTGEQVLRSLSPPDRVSRIVTQDTLTEQWLYESVPAYCIVLTRRLDAPPGEPLRVVEYFLRGGR